MTGSACLPRMRAAAHREVMPTAKTEGCKIPNLNQQEVSSDLTVHPGQTTLIRTFVSMGYTHYRV